MEPSIRCGEAQGQHQWAMVAVSDRVCVRCAQWYVTRAGTSHLWTTESRQQHRMRGLIRFLIPETCPFGSETVVTAVMEALHGLSGDGPSTPGGCANLFRWGWLPAVVASALRNHPRWLPEVTRIEAQAWQNSAQQLERHDHLLTDQYWADMWAWRQVRPDATQWRTVGLDSFWPDAAGRVPGGGGRKETPTAMSFGLSARNVVTPTGTPRLLAQCRAGE